jgi:tellurite resistance protein
MTESHPPRLQYFPAAWFAMIMGLSGLTLAWRKAEENLNLSINPSMGLLLLVTSLFVIIAALYTTKIVKYRAAAQKEWAHPIKMHFVPAVSIALILLSIAWLPISAAYSKLLWIAGVSLHLVLTLYVITQWMHHSKFEIMHLNPAWFIPVVGNILIPIAGVTHAPIEISWFFFSIGLVFWPVLLTIILYRVIFHTSMPERLMPTLFILIAPPAIGFISYVKLVGEVDAFAQVLYHSALFFTLLLFSQIRYFTNLKFFLSWWAYSFPLAAITIASFVMFEQSGSLLFLRISGVLLGIASVVITGLLIRTAMAVKRQEICVEE